MTYVVFSIWGRAETVRFCRYAGESERQGGCDAARRPPLLPLPGDGERDWDWI